MPVFVRHCVASDGTPIPRAEGEGGAYVATAIWCTGDEVVVTVDGVQYRGRAAIANRGEPIKVPVVIDWVPYVRIVVM